MKGEISILNNEARPSRRSEQTALPFGKSIDSIESIKSIKHLPGILFIRVRILELLKRICEKDGFAF